MFEEKCRHLCKWDINVKLGVNCMIPINVWVEAILNGLVNAGNSWERDTECCGSSDVNSHFFNLVYPTNSC